MTTGERIKKRRNELGISADKLADQIGVSRSTMFRYESGAIEKMPMNNLVPIARALNTTVGFLMGWEDDANRADTISNTENGNEALCYFDKLSPERKAEALNYLRYLVQSEEK